MRIIRHPKPKSLKGSVVALGTFDGVHRGHQEIIRQTVRHARRIGAASLALTFDPHPQQLIVPERGLKLLTTLAEREALFAALGIDGVLVIRFDHRVQALSYEKFACKYLVRKLGVRRVFVGYDHAFGQGRRGDVSQLKALGERYDFAVTVVPAVKAGRQPIKSRRIRELISGGAFNRALKLLGHPYQLAGRVVRGTGRGKELGFPTANLKVDQHKLVPAHGVYTGRVNSQRCVVNIGARPTFGLGGTLVEVHIPGFHGSLRGRRLKVILTRRLRPELQFSDVESLKRQIRKDIKRMKLL